MKKIFSYAIIYICLLFNLSSCDFLKSYRFEDITNHDFIDIDSITYSLGYDQPYSSTFNGNIYKYLNVKYNKVSKIDYKNMDYHKINPGYLFAFYIEIDSLTFDFVLYNNYFYVYGIDGNLYKTVERYDRNVIVNEIQKTNKTMIVEVTYDYGIHVENIVSVLLNGCFVFFNIKEYNIDKLVGGDYLIIAYTGDFMVKEIYPSIFEGIDFNIISIEQYIPAYIEYEVIFKDDVKSLIPTNSSLSNYVINTKYVVNEDNSFINVDDLDEGSIVYGANPSYYSSLTIPYLFSYLPRINTL